ncbi:MAG: hypothetical protein PHW24_05180 [Candidatus Moranbacteria bacterium]|nr:hypothetical protein [Candidatus Moranbacteria bacterium]
MTCIIGVERNNHIWIGGDSCSSNYYENRVIKYPKVFSSGPFLIGYTSSFRMGQLLQFSLKFPEENKKAYLRGDYEFMVSGFVNAIRECLKEGGFSEIENNQEHGGEFIVGYRHRLYQVYSDFQVTCFEDGIYACGSGSQYAVGALTHLLDIDPVDVAIEKALRTAQKYSTLVLPPFTILKD